MEPRRVNGKNHWYHETQSTICPVDVLPLVPEAAHVEDRFLLDLTLPAAWLRAHADWLHPARQLAELLFPDQVAVSRLQTFTAYDRLSTALTVAQVYGVQRLCNHYAARLAPLPGPDSSRESNRRLAQITQYARQLAGSPSVINALSRSQLDEVGLTSPGHYSVQPDYRIRRLPGADDCRPAGGPGLSGALDPRYAPARGGTRGAVRPAAGSMAGRHCGSRPAVCR